MLALLLPILSDLSFWPCPRPLLPADEARPMDPTMLNARLDRLGRAIGGVLCDLELETSVIDLGEPKAATGVESSRGDGPSRSGGNRGGAVSW